MQLVYFTAPANGAGWFSIISRRLIGGGGDHNPLQRCSQSILQSRLTGLDGLVSYPGDSLVGGCILLQRCSRYILHPQPSGLLFRIWTWLTEFIFFDNNPYSSHVSKVNIITRKSRCSWYVYIYPTPPPWAGCDTRSNFKWSSAGLNSEFSFF